MGTTAEQPDGLDEQLQALVGRPLSDRGAALAPDPVNQPMIRHWAAAFEDENPVYTDPAAAAALALRRDRRTAVHAPDLDHGDAAHHRDRGARRFAGRGAAAPACIRLLDDAGYVGTLASNSEFEIVRYLRLGDELRATTVLDSVSAEKQTRLGPGYFVTWVTTYTDETRRDRRPPALPHPQVPSGGAA